MQTVPTEHSNRVFELPGGTDENDLWVFETVTEEENAPVICSTWVPSDEERAAIARGDNVELIVWGTSHPPVAVRTTEAQPALRSKDELVAERDATVAVRITVHLPNAFGHGFNRELKREITYGELRREDKSAMELFERVQRPAVEWIAKWEAPDESDAEFERILWAKPHSEAAVRAYLGLPSSG
jgi:hypothetical protein